jgi:hypothetical protein
LLCYADKTITYKSKTVKYDIIDRVSNSGFRRQHACYAIGNFSTTMVCAERIADFELKCRPKPWQSPHR